MNGFMAAVGYCVTALAVLLVLAIAVGKLFDRKPDAEAEDWDPAPRNLAPHVVPPWRPGVSDLDDPNSRDTPPHDPAPQDRPGA